VRFAYGMLFKESVVLNQMSLAQVTVIGATRQI